MRALGFLAVVIVAPFMLSNGAWAQALAPLELDDDGVVPYFIALPLDDAQARPADAELAVWALESWQRAAGGALKFVRAASEDDALVRVYWVPAGGGAVR